MMIHHLAVVVEPYQRITLLIHHLVVVVELLGHLQSRYLTTKHQLFLKTVSCSKGGKPLPPINKIQLQQPETVVEKYPKLLNIAKIPTLSVRLAKESFFDKEIMKLCIVRGTGSFIQYQLLS